MFARARAARHRRAAKRAAFQMNVHFDGRVAARIENLAADDLADGGLGHECASLGKRRRDDARLRLACLHNVPAETRELHDVRRR